MKRIISLFLVASAVLSLMACTPSAGLDEPDMQDQPGNSQDEVDIAEQVILNQYDLLVTAKSLDLAGELGPELKVTIANNREDDIAAYVLSLSVNNAMIQSNFEGAVGAGKTEEHTIVIPQRQLDIAGIELIKDIEFVFRVDSYPSYEVIFYSPVIKIETSADPSYEQAFDDKGHEVYNNQGVRIVIKAYEAGTYAYSSEQGINISTFIENSSQQNIVITIRSFSINGYAVNPVYYNEIGAGKVAFQPIFIYQTDLDKNGIEGIEQIELVCDVVDTSDYQVLFSTGKITIDMSQIVDLSE